MDMKMNDASHRQAGNRSNGALDARRWRTPRAERDDLPAAGFDLFGDDPAGLGPSDDAAEAGARTAQNDSCQVVAMGGRWSVVGGRALVVGGRNDER